MTKLTPKNDSNDEEKEDMAIMIIHNRPIFDTKEDLVADKRILKYFKTVNRLYVLKPPVLVSKVTRTL